MTDGTVAIWNVTWAVKGLPAPEQVMKTVGVLPKLHAMGVNTLHVRSARSNGQDVILLATGGDDNSIRYSILTFKHDHIGAILESTCAVPCACASALKSVWSDGKRIFAVGWNQRLSVWRVSEKQGKNNAMLAKYNGDH